MQSLNNLDIIILIIVGISALIALSRGLIKEVLSIIGWVLAVVCVVYLLPLVTPFAGKYIDSPAAAAVASASAIVIIFFIIWILLTGQLIGKVRSSKLSGIDRILGLFFGIARAFLLVILFYILINWMVPKDKQAETLTQSKYFNIAGSFAKPIEDLIPEATLAQIREKTKSAGGEINGDDSDEEVEEKLRKKTDIDALFEMLAQPKVAKKKEPVLIINNDKVNEKIAKEKAAKAAEEAKAKEKGYNEHERDNLDRLIENTVE